MQLISLIVLILSFFFFGNVYATVLTNANAPQGGTYTYNLGQGPTSLNPLSSTGAYSSRVQSYILESLGDKNMDTYEWEPALATSWDISKDGKSFTFRLRKGVKWHDGKPFTAQDVKFTFEAVTDPANKYKTAHRRSYYEGIEKVEVLDPHQVKFITKTRYFLNFDIAAGMPIVPEHLYKDTSKKNLRKLRKNIWGTGAYRFKRLRKGKFVELIANKDWWGRKDASKKGTNNFNQIRLRFIQDGEMAIRRMERGELDFLGLSAEEYFKKTNGPKWGKSVHRVKVENLQGKGYGFIGLNQENTLFQNRNIRKALFHLLNREMMIKKFRYGNSLLATGPWYRQSAYANPDVKPILFDPKKARSIFKKEGWKDTDGDKILDKVIKGKKTKFSFTILEPSDDFMKYLTMFKEDAKLEGVEVKIKRIDWSTFIKLLDEKKFDAVRLGWSGGSIDIDPKQIWHSQSAGPGGSNFISYKNEKVDKLIDKARQIYDKEKRIVLLRKVYRMIAEDIPYLFFFNDKAIFYGRGNNVKTVKDTYRYGIGHSTYWWFGT